MPKGTTKKVAQDKLDEIRRQLREGTYMAPAKIPTFKEVAKEWLEHKKMNLRPTTWSVYEGHTVTISRTSTIFILTGFPPR